MAQNALILSLHITHQIGFMKFALQHKKYLNVKGYFHEVQLQTHHTSVKMPVFLFIIFEKTCKTYRRYDFQEPRWGFYYCCIGAGKQSLLFP